MYLNHLHRFQLSLWLLLELLMAPVLSAQEYRFSDQLNRLGFDKESVCDWSDSSRIMLPEPTLAYINMHDATDFPTTTTSRHHDWLEYYDGQGNYFRKHVIIKLQGRSSIYYPKRNLSLDFFDDATFSGAQPDIKFGNWVKQDGFHLKAFYTDWFRGISIVNYQLYREIEQTLPKEENRYWKRCGITDGEHARCYPDGFPVILYFNDKFYGIYTLSLKKHRRNMAMQKDDPHHIHLDGELSSTSIFKGNIDWSRFEIRNPKSIFTTTTGEPYDSDNPSEPADCETKDCIQALSDQDLQLWIESYRLDSTDMRALIADYFDLQGFIDYTLYSFVNNNMDGFCYNWQWFTYDGHHWCIAPYDMDCCYGAFAHGGRISPPSHNLIINGLSSHGVYWVYRYFLPEIRARYAELRTAGLFSADHISDLAQTWTSRIGPEFFDMEWQRWPNSPCIGQTESNPGWELSDDWSNYNSLTEWDPNTTYQPNDRCRQYDVVWQATAVTTGVSPCVHLRHQDSHARLHAWVDERIQLLDEHFGYDYDKADLRPITLPSSSAIEAVSYDLFGRPQSHLRSSRLRVTPSHKLIYESR